MEILRKTLKAYIIAIVLFLLLTFLFALIIKYTAFPEELSFAGLVVILTVITLMLGIIEGNIVGKRGLLTGLAAAFLFLMMILFTAGGAFAGSFGIESFDPFYLIPLLSGGVGGILGANSKR